MLTRGPSSVRLQRLLWILKRMEVYGCITYDVVKECTGISLRQYWRDIAALRRSGLRCYAPHLPASEMGLGFMRFDGFDLSGDFLGVAS